MSFNGFLVTRGANPGCDAPCVRHGRIDIKNRAFGPGGAEFRFPKVSSQLSQMPAEHPLVGGRGGDVTGLADAAGRTQEHCSSPRLAPGTNRAGESFQHLGDAGVIAELVSNGH